MCLNTIRKVRITCLIFVIFSVYTAALPPQTRPAVRFTLRDVDEAVIEREKTQLLDRRISSLQKSFTDDLSKLRRGAGMRKWTHPRPVKNTPANSKSRRETAADLPFSQSSPYTPAESVAVYDDSDSAPHDRLRWISESPTVFEEYAKGRRSTRVAEGVSSNRDAPDLTFRIWDFISSTKSDGGSTTAANENTSRTPEFSNSDPDSPEKRSGIKLSAKRTIERASFKGRQDHGKAPTPNAPRSGVPRSFAMKRADRQYYQQLIEGGSDDTDCLQAMRLVRSATLKKTEGAHRVAELRREERLRRVGARKRVEAVSGGGKQPIIKKMPSQHRGAARSANGNMPQLLTKAGGGKLIHLKEASRQTTNAKKLVSSEEVRSALSSKGARSSTPTLSSPFEFGRKPPLRFPLHVGAKGVPKRQIAITYTAADKRDGSPRRQLQSQSLSESFGAGSRADIRFSQTPFKRHTEGFVPLLVPLSAAPSRRIARVAVDAPGSGTTREPRWAAPLNSLKRGWANGSNDKMFGGTKVASMTEEVTDAMGDVAAGAGAALKSSLGLLRRSLARLGLEGSRDKGRSNLGEVVSDTVGSVSSAFTRVAAGLFNPRKYKQLRQENLLKETEELLGHSDNRSVEEKLVESVTRRNLPPPQTVAHTWPRTFSPPRVSRAWL